MMPLDYPELPYHKCLNAGFVALVDVMGSDASVVQAARVSYGKGTKSTREDAALISYLLRNRHTTPFEMCEMKFLCRMPIFVARQWIRHRTASVNEYSGRYSEMKDIFFIPHIGSIAIQSESNKQGRVEEDLASWARKLNVSQDDLAVAAAGLSLETEIYWAHRALLMRKQMEADVRSAQPAADQTATEAQASARFGGDYQKAREIQFAITRANEEASATYQKLLKTGLTKELARVVLPLTQYTEWYWKMDLHNLLSFLRLRLDKHAQAEMRVFAEAIALFVQQSFPMVWNAFQEMNDGCMLTADERLAIVASLNLDSEREEIAEKLRDTGYSDRRLIEFWKKILKS